MLVSIWLKQNHGQIVRWPENEIGEEHTPEREGYLATVRAADGGDMEPLYESHSRYIEGG
jgi:hypothetical protein